MITTSLNPVELLALSKLTADSEVRDAIDPGEYSGTLHVAVDYELTVGEDYEQAQVNKIPWQKAVMVLMSKLNGVTLESVLREVVEGTLDDKQIKAEAKAAMAAIMGSAKQPHKGKVTSHVVASPIMKGGL